MQISLFSKTGLEHAECEDAVLVNKKVFQGEAATLSATIPCLFAIADGVGGNPGGKKASSTTLQLVSDKVFTKVPENIEEFHELLTNVNVDLIKFANNQEDQEESSMATTLTVIYTLNDKYFLGHIGNTRLYSAQGPYLRQITKDQTSYQYYLDSGVQAPNVPRNIINYCFGGGSLNYGKGLVTQEIFKDRAPKCLLLTSDGIHEYLSQDELEDLLANDLTDLEKVEKMCNKAIDNGSQDDITSVIVRL